MNGAQNANAQGTVGQTLKSLREAQNLSLADVASRMRLDPRIIAAMENADHQALPSALYVRGYLRGYGRILGTDPENLVNLYNEEAPSTPPDIQPEMSRPSQHSSEDAPVRAATVAVIALLGVLLVAWWQTTYLQQSAGRVAATSTTSPEPAPAAEPVPPPQPVSQLPYSYAIVQHPTTAYYRAPDRSDDPGATLDATAATALPMTTGTEPAPMGTAPTGPDAIRLQATSDSWVEITDRSGERIYMDFIHGGESLTLTGHAPFNVLLGYAIGMAVEFNGQSFDTAPYMRAGVARFSLGQ